MHEPDFWTQTADAMEMSIEGNRLIAREIADLCRDLWRRVMRSLASVTHNHRRHVQ